MADLAREPSMEDILASIKRIIAEDGAAPAPPPRLRRGAVQAANEPDGVLELTEQVAAAPPVAPARPSPLVPNPAPGFTPSNEQVEAPPPEPPAAGTDTSPPPAPPLVSDQVASASRQSLAALSAMIVTASPGADNTLEALVRDLLRPILKDWLDARLPEIVEGLVSREIARITGRSL